MTHYEGRDRVSVWSPYWVSIPGVLSGFAYVWLIGSVLYAVSVALDW